MQETVLHADDALLVVAKPAGLPAVPARDPALADNLTRRLQGRWPQARVVHRLDMATSGLMVFALAPAAQRALGAAFAERRVHKDYVAVVAGQPQADAGEIDLPLAADWPQRPRQQVDHARGKPALTRWRVLVRDAEGSRLALQPLTGRSHQLRVHLQALGHPIVGDTLYAPPEVQARAPRLLLHACGLGFAHPASGQWLRFEHAAPF